MSYPYFVTDLINVVAEYEQEQQAHAASSPAPDVAPQPSRAERIVQRLSQWTTHAKPATRDAVCLPTCAEPSRS